MAGDRKVDFYAGKSRTLPRFAYRRLKDALLGRAAPRADAIEAALAELTEGRDPDLRKFKFVIPETLKTALTADEYSRWMEATAPRRTRASRLKMVFPHVSDEFSLDQAFLASLFDLDAGPEVAADGVLFTIGSCFARNIAEYLAENGHDAIAFQLAEDLNSPISNAYLFHLMGQSPAQQAQELAHWTRLIFPELSESDSQRAVSERQAEIADLAAQIRTATCVVLTLGNVVDFFRDHNQAGATLAEKIVPKFIALPGQEDIEVRSSAAQRLKSRGATFRLATYAETCEAIRYCIRGARSLTQAPIVVTVSPVPIDSVIGLSEETLKSAIEVDCVSKSRLRSALHEVMATEANSVSALYYFPSFEIVRWVAPMLDMPVFGWDDAASRHVSSPILNAVCGLFVQRFLRFLAAPRREQAAPERLSNGAFCSAEPPAGSL
jgi:hypothetical protein